MNTPPQDFAGNSDAFILKPGTPSTMLVISTMVYNCGCESNVES